MNGFFLRLIRGPTARASVLLGFAMALFLAVTVVAPTTAGAQSLVPRDKVENLLKAQYGEAPVARGLAQNGWMIEVFASSGGETWTIVFTTPQGLSRIASAGVSWTQLDAHLGQLSRMAQVE